MKYTPISDRVEQDLGIRPVEQIRPRWSFAESDARARRAIRARAAARPGEQGTRAAS